MKSGISIDNTAAVAKTDKNFKEGYSKDFFKRLFQLPADQFITFMDSMSVNIIDKAKTNKRYEDRKKTDSAAKLSKQDTCIRRDFDDMAQEAYANFVALGRVQRKNILRLLDKVISEDKSVQGGDTNGN